MATTHQKIVRFDGNNFRTWNKSVLASGFKGCSYHPHGLIGFIQTQADFVAFTTVPGGAVGQPFQPLPDPGAIPNAGAQFGQWEYIAKRKEKELEAINSWRIVFEDSLDDISVSDMSEDNTLGITRRTLAWMFAWMRTQHGAETTDTLDDNLDLMDTIFVDDGSQPVMTYISAHHTEPHRIAAANGGALPETTKVSKLTKGLAACGSFKEVLFHFTMTYRTPATQVYADLTSAIRTFDSGRGKRQITGGSGLVNQVTAESAAILALTAKLEVMQTMIEALSTNAANAARIGASSNGRDKQTAASEVSVKEVKFLAYQNSGSCYCWSHGPNRSHESAGCERPRVGHKTQATSQNKMGGAKVYTPTVK
jgi:hypothetical protein